MEACGTDRHKGADEAKPDQGQPDAPYEPAQGNGQEDQPQHAAARHGEDEQALDLAPLLIPAGKLRMATRDGGDEGLQVELLVDRQSQEQHRRRR